jgi:CheY-like chemotaxis protein
VFKILLVDDERDFVESLAIRLGQRGISVACAFSGSEALKQLEAEDAVDVVFLDVGMPDYGGYAIGYRVVQAYLERTGNTIEAATFVSVAEIVAESGYFD